MKYLAILAVLFFVGCSESTTSTTTNSTSGSKEHSYVRNRFKMEGYSNEDSETAAKAIMKFQEAQRKRKY